MSTIHSLPSRDAKQPLVVRIGGQPQRITQGQPRVTESAMSAAVQSKVVRKSGLDWFGRGITVGLALGCLCLVLFHQLNPTTRVPTPTTVAPTTSSANSGRSHQHLIAAGPPITIPAVRLFAVVSKHYDNETTAMQVADGIRQTGQVAFTFATSGTGFRSGRSQHHDFVNVYGLGSYSADLTRVARDHAGEGASIVPFQWNASVVASATGTPAEASARTTSWLSAEASAMSAVVAGVMDKEPLVDATTAVHSADRLMPAERQLRLSGWKDTLVRIHQLTDGGLLAAVQGHRTTAVGDIVNGYALLNRLRAQK